ncbi:hypothetical protein [Streptomyces sp. NPDC059278]|uniref:hypothetical protein n=1 Tax=Streptomyces sp. NPDC059278 TaxID=3346801 RepID=UPI0036776DD3
MSAALTLSGATVSIAVLAINVRSWWKSKREIKDLLPFGGGLVQGASWTLCVGGLLGWVAVRAAGAGSSAGDWSVSRVTGTGGGGTLAAGSMGALTSGGACVVVAALIVGFVMFKAAGKEAKKKIIGGLFVGLTLTATAGFAQLMQWLPDAYNALGAGVTDALNGVLSL